MKRKGIIKNCGALVAGVVNGLLGTGAGTVLFLTHSDKDTQQKYTQSLMVVLVGVYSLVGIILRGIDTSKIKVLDVVYLLAGGIAGSFVGALLLSKMKGKYIRLIFAVLLIISGVRMLF